MYSQHGVYIELHSYATSTMTSTVTHLIPLEAISDQCCQCSLPIVSPQVIIFPKDFFWSLLRGFNKWKAFDHFPMSR